MRWPLHHPAPAQDALRSDIVGRVPVDVDAALIVALLETFLPQYPTLTEAAHRQVELDVADFLSARLCSMPTHVGIPYRLALKAFDWLAILTSGARYRRLDRRARERYLARWTDSRYGFMRDLMKVARGCVLLSYFDHPLVVEALEHGE